MHKKQYSPKWLMNYKAVILIAFSVIILIAASNFFGIGTIRSAIRIGYDEHTGGQSWSASYTMLDGKMKRAIDLKDTQDMLHVEIVTEDGSISMEMKDADGNVIFDENNIETSVFDVKASGNVVVRIEADQHKGSFSIEAAE